MLALVTVYLDEKYADRTRSHITFKKDLYNQRTSAPTLLYLGDIQN